MPYRGPAANAECARRERLASRNHAPCGGGGFGRGPVRPRSGRIAVKLRAARSTMVLLLLCSGVVVVAAAQEPPAAPDTAGSQTTPRIPTPAGAFARTLLIPGWGHAAFGAYTRGGIYFAMRAANGYMLMKTISRLSQAREIERRHSGLVRDSLRMLAAEDTAMARRFEAPGALDEAIAMAPGTKGVRDLVGARKQQREDWIAWNVFWLLMSGVDAYVTAQLADFPVQLSANPGPGGAVRFEARVPVSRP
jgi:hypothetical protein